MKKWLKNAQKCLEMAKINARREKMVKIKALIDMKKMLKNAQKCLEMAKI